MFLASLFGGKGQKSTNTNTYTDTQKTITKIMSEATQTTMQSASNSNKLKVKMKKSSKNCPITLNQTIESSQVSIAKIDKTLSNTLTESINKQLKQAATANIEKKTDIVGTLGSIMGGGTKQEVITNVDTKIDKLTKSTFSKKSIQNISQIVTNKNDAELDIGVCNGPMDLEQNVVNKQIASALSQSLTKNIKSSNLDTVLNTESSGDISQEDTTISSITDMISNIFMGYSAIYGSSSCAIMCCCMGVLVFAMSSGGQQMAKNANLGKLAGSVGGAFATGRGFVPPS